MIKKLMALAVSTCLLVLSMSVISNAEGSDSAFGSDASLLIERSDINIAEGNVYDLTADVNSDEVMALTTGAIVVQYRSTSSSAYQSLFSVSNATEGNADRHFHLYATPSGTLGMELRNTDNDFKYVMSVPNAVTHEKTNTVAFKMDSTDHSYKLFANGKIVSSMSKDIYKSFSDILGLNTVSLGGTVREGVVKYPFGGIIKNFKIFAGNISDESLETITGSSVSTGILLDKSGLRVTEGQGINLSNEVQAEAIENLHEGTFIVSFASESENPYQSLISVGNSTSGNQDRHFHLYITNTGAVGMELRNTDSVFKYTMSRPAALTGMYKGQKVINTVAFKADANKKQYKIFANGELLDTLSRNDYKFISDITGVDNVTLGGTIRQNAVAYPFGGTVSQVQVYGSALSDEQLLDLTGKTTYGQKIFLANDVTKANYFRIPTLLTLSDGTMIATADARYGGTHDAKSNIDIAFSKSVDGGETWSEPILPLCFEDYEAQAVDWPRDSTGKNVQIQGSAAFIDSVTIEDRLTGRIFLFADAMPAGIGFSNTAAGSGFKTIGGEKYVKLRMNNDSAYNYTIRGNGTIYDDRTNQPTEYTVDGEYNILRNGDYLYQKQYKVYFEGSTLHEVTTDVDVKQNVFYKDSLFKVLPTNFIVMKYSDDHGNTWSSMKILGKFKGDNQRMPLYGPGVGTQIKNGKYAGRMIISMYNSISAEFGFIYSDDHGETWNYITTDLGGSGTFAEAQIVELPDGTLQTYMRTSVGKIGVITSIDGGITWTKQAFVPGMTAASYGTQLSVINYSSEIDGKKAILLSAPNATDGRRAGKIWIGLITDTGQQGYDKYSIDWKYCYPVDKEKYGFAYSCMAQTPDGKIGILYEKYDSWSRNELHLKNILKYESYTIEELIAASR